MGDGAARIFLNTKGTMEDVSASLRAFLDYVDGRLSDDSFVQELEEAVVEIVHDHYDYRPEEEEDGVVGDGRPVVSALE